MFKIENLTSPNGNKVANQFQIKVSNGYIFQSYESTVAAWSSKRKVINKYYYKYSNTTTKYTCSFFHLYDSKTLHQEVKESIIELLDQKAFDKFIKSIK